MFPPSTWVWRSDLRPSPRHNKLVREKNLLVGQLLDVFIDPRSPALDGK
jgi:hypothetical protein